MGPNAVAALDHEPVRREEHDKSTHGPDDEAEDAPVEPQDCPGEGLVMRVRVVRHHRSSSNGYPSRGEIHEVSRGLRRGTRGCVDASRVNSSTPLSSRLTASWYSCSSLTAQMSKFAPIRFCTASIAVSIEWSWLLYLCRPFGPTSCRLSSPSKKFRIVRSAPM